jgi:CRISPR/Cas system CSM-associated protein Csm4 (group 5 of RAMP superfamily)
MRDVMFESHNSYYYFSQEIIHQYRFVLSKRSELFIEEFKKKIFEYKASIKEGSIFVRAQKGNDYRDIDQDGIVITQVPCAFSIKRMKPLENQSSRLLKFG